MERDPNEGGTDVGRDIVRDLDDEPQASFDEAPRVSVSPKPSPNGTMTSRQTEHPAARREPPRSSSNLASRGCLHHYSAAETKSTRARAA